MSVITYLSLSLTHAARSSSVHMAFKAIGRNRSTLEQVKEESMREGDDKEQEINHAKVVCSLVRDRWRAGSFAALTGGLLPTTAPGSCPAIVWEPSSLSECLLFTGAYSCGSESCFYFLKTVPVAQGKGGHVERQKTLKGEEENGFCQIVYIAPLLHLFLVTS